MSNNMAFGEQEMFGQQVVGVYLKILFRYSSAGTDENKEKPQTRQSASRPKLEPGTPRNTNPMFTPSDNLITWLGSIHAYT